MTNVSIRVYFKEKPGDGSTKLNLLNGGVVVVSGSQMCSIGFGDCVYFKKNYDEQIGDLFLLTPNLMLVQQEHSSFFEIVDTVTGEQFLIVNLNCRIKYLRCNVDNQEALLPENYENPTYIVVMLESGETLVHEFVDNKIELKFNIAASGLECISFELDQVFSNRAETKRKSHYKLKIAMMCIGGNLFVVT